MCAAPIRSEMWKLAYAIETNPGNDPYPASNTGYTNTFGIVQNVTMPDPQIDINNFWGLGTASIRNWFVSYHGKQTLSGSIPNFLLTDGKCLRLPIGNVTDYNSSGYYTHIINEAVTLPSISLHTTYVNADGTVELMRRFHGGKINRMTISAQEGGYLTCSIDDMQFMRYKHNISGVSDISASYNSTMVDLPLMSTLYSCDQPYLFATGTLSLWGTTFARIRSFNLSIDNGCMPKYYVQNSSSLPLPYEIREGKRNYNLGVTVDIEDSALYRELLRMGSYNSVYTGFQTVISFSRGTNDVITFVTPSTTPACGGDAMGCLIKTAPHNISTGDLLVGVPLSITCRNLSVVISDQYSTYP
jgi:hypothetical protein